MYFLQCFGLGQECCSAEQGGQPEYEGQVGDVIDEGVFNYGATIAGGFAHHKGKHQVCEAGAVGHDEGAEHGAFKTFAFHDMQAPDHHPIRQRKNGELKQGMCRVGLEGGEGAIDTC